MDDTSDAEQIAKIVFENNSEAKFNLLRSALSKLKTQEKVELMFDALRYDNDIFTMGHKYNIKDVKIIHSHKCYNDNTHHECVRCMIPLFYMFWT